MCFGIGVLIQSPEVSPKNPGRVHKNASFGSFLYVYSSRFKEPEAQDVCAIAGIPGDRKS